MAPSFKQSIAVTAPRVPYGHAVMVCGAKALADGADMTTTKAIQAVSCGGVAVQHVAVCSDCIQRAAGGPAAQTR